VKGEWKEQLTYHYGRLRVARVELLNSEAPVRKAFVSVMTALTQGVEVDVSAALVTAAAELITEHTDEQHCSTATTLLCPTQ
jgi:hypothetical protein